MNGKESKLEEGDGSFGTSGETPLLEWHVREAVVGKKAKKRTVLRNIDGDASPGDLVAIMGPSGSGKTTLIECLSLRNRSFDGVLRKCGQSVGPSFFAGVAVVYQDEELFGYITPREHLLFHATTLARPGKARRDLLSTRVNSLIAELGLQKCADTLIGGSGGTTFTRKGLSGGERKRLAIATGLLSSPDLIFLDEPTSGLDSVMSLEVVLSLYKVSQEGMLVMASLHCPSSAMTRLITHVLLLTTDGQLAYYGPMAAVASHFESLGFHLPLAYNPFDYLIDLVSQPPDLATLGLSDDGGGDGDIMSEVRVTPSSTASHTSAKSTAANTELLKERNNRLVQAFASKPHSRDMNLLLENTHKQPLGSPGVGTSSWVLFRLNMWRGTLQATRDWPTFILLILACVVIGSMLGLLFYNQAAYNWRNFTGLLFTVVCTLFLIVVATQTWSFPAEWVIVHREYLASSNAWGPYLAAKIIFNIPFALGALSLASSAYWMGGLNPAPSSFLTYVGVIAIFQQAAAATGLWCSSFSSNQAVGLVVMATVSAPIVVFSGLVYERSATPAYLKWLEDISIVNHAFSALVSLQVSILPPQARSVVLLFTEVDVQGTPRDLTALAILTACFYSLTYVNLKIRAVNALR